MEHLNQTIERTTLSNLVSNEEYCRKVLPFIKPDYFDVKEERVVFEEITNFVDKYKRIPTKISLEIEVETRKDLTDVEHKKIVEIIQTLDSTDVDMEWLVDTTEKFLFTQLAVGARRAEFTWVPRMNLYSIWLFYILLVNWQVKQ